jgi:hypothetical protein
MFSQIQHGLLHIYLLPTHPPIYLVNYLPTYYPFTHTPIIYLPTYLPIFSHSPIYRPTYIFRLCMTYLLTYPTTYILSIYLSTHLLT